MKKAKWMKLISFKEANKMTGEDKKQALYWNSIAYDLNFKELDRMWKKLVKYSRPNSTNGGTVLDTTDLKDPYFCKLLDIEKTLHKEEQVLKYGHMQAKADYCTSCDMYHDYKGCKDRCALGRCKWIVNIDDDLYIGKNAEWKMACLKKS